MNPLIQDDRLEEVCGCLVRKGCSDAVFNLKSALQMRKEYEHKTCVVFVGLVEAFDTVNHELIFTVMKKYDFSPTPSKSLAICIQHSCWISRRVGRTSLLEYPIGVPLGDNLAPLLFVLVYQVTIESLNAIHCDLPTPLLLKFFTNTNIDSPRGHLTGQPLQSACISSSQSQFM